VITCVIPCKVSDETLDATTADVGPCVAPCGICLVSDEALDATHADIITCYPCMFCQIGDEVHATL